ncbi:hypothetical protein DIPPA_17494 [Diplonema papillatum]|nr:hypothetical protein DIPPA_17494 [Diplonema papillatum]
MSSLTEHRRSSVFYHGRKPSLAVSDRTPNYVRLWRKYLCFVRAAVRLRVVSRCSLTQDEKTRLEAAHQQAASTLRGIEGIQNLFARLGLPLRYDEAEDRLDEVGWVRGNVLSLVQLLKIVRPLKKRHLSQTDEEQRCSFAALGGAEDGVVAGCDINAALAAIGLQSVVDEERMFGYCEYERAVMGVNGGMVLSERQHDIAMDELLFHGEAAAQRIMHYRHQSSKGKGTVVVPYREVGEDVISAQNLVLETGKASLAPGMGNVADAVKFACALNILAADRKKDTAAAPRSPLMALPAASGASAPGTPFTSFVRAPFGSRRTVDRFDEPALPYGLPSAIRFDVRANTSSRVRRRKKEAKGSAGENGLSPANSRAPSPACRTHAWGEALRGCLATPERQLAAAACRKAACRKAACRKAAAAKREWLLAQGAAAPEGAEGEGMNGRRERHPPALLPRGGSRRLTAAEAARLFSDPGDAEAFARFQRQLRRPPRVQLLPPLKSRPRRDSKPAVADEEAPAPRVALWSCTAPVRKAPARQRNIAETYAFGDF